MAGLWATKDRGISRESESKDKHSCPFPNLAQQEYSYNAPQGPEKKFKEPSRKWTDFPPAEH